MTGIRPVELSDIEEIAALYERVARSGTNVVPQGLAEQFARYVFDHPWADAELPSLVFETARDGIVGFIGSHVRHVRVGGERIRAVCSGQLVSDRDRANPTVGPLLLRALIGGDQDLTFTDGASPLVRDIWCRFGGAVLYPESLSWVRVLRPSAAASHRLLARYNSDRLRTASRPVMSMLDRGAEHWTKPSPPSEQLRSSILHPGDYVQLYQRLCNDFGRVEVDWDTPFVDWLMEELRHLPSRGELVCKAFHRSGKPVGYYVALVEKAKVARLLELTALPADVGVVLDHLLEDVWSAGASALQGRLEPSLFEPVARRGSLIVPSERVLFHAKQAELLAEVRHHHRISRFAGEWWMGHHTEQFVENRGPRGRASASWIDSAVVHGS